MLRPLMPSSPRGLAKGCLYALALLAPGSFAVFVIIWLVRLWVGRRRQMLMRMRDGASAVSGV